MPDRRSGPSCRAFTLVELIVVVVVLAILVAIGAFAYQQFVDSSRKTAAETTAAQVGKTVAAASAATRQTSAAVVTDVADNGATGPWESDTDAAVTPGAENADGSRPVSVETAGYCVQVTFTDRIGNAGTVAEAAAGSCAPPVVVQETDGTFGVGKTGGTWVETGDRHTANAVSGDGDMWFRYDATYTGQHGIKLLYATSHTTYLKAIEFAVYEANADGSRGTRLVWGDLVGDGATHNRTMEAGKSYFVMIGDRRPRAEEGPDWVKYEFGPGVVYNN